MVIVRSRRCSAVACNAVSLQGSVGRRGEDLSWVVSDSKSKPPTLIETSYFCTNFPESNVLVWSYSRITLSFQSSKYGCNFNRSCFFRNIWKPLWWANKTGAFFVEVRSSPISKGVNSGSGCSIRLYMPMVVASSVLVYSCKTQTGNILLSRSREDKTFLQDKLIDEALFATVCKTVFGLRQKNEPQIANISLIDGFLFELWIKS